MTEKEFTIDFHFQDLGLVRASPPRHVHATLVL